MSLLRAVRQGLRVTRTLNYVTPFARALSAVAAPSTEKCLSVEVTKEGIAVITMDAPDSKVSRVVLFLVPSEH
jgi:hypothetical protein